MSYETVKHNLLMASRLLDENPARPEGTRLRLLEAALAELSSASWGGAGAAVCYGKDNYSDNKDPRSANARAHAMQDDKVTAVHLTVHTRPAQRYHCTHVAVIDEVAAGGRTLCTVMVLDQAGALLSAQDARLAYEYSGQSNQFATYLPASNDKGEFIITNKGWPPALFPLAVVVLDAEGYIDSDVVGNLGLPLGHHVSFVITFQER